jgi:hypothetical protein
MTIAHRIITAKDFVETTATGPVDLKAARKLLGKLADAVQAAGDVNILLDVRDAYSDWSEDQMHELMGELASLLSTFRNKLAVVHSNRRPGHARIAKRASADATFEMEIFTDYKQAIDWLNDAVYFDIQFDGDMPTDRS